MRAVKIAGKKIGPGSPCFIIAEAGVNHNGDLKKAKRLIGAASAAGADAVKFQTFKADRLVTANAPKAAYQTRAGVKDSHYAMLKRLELSVRDHRVLKAYAGKKKIIFLSSPFDLESADVLDALKVPAFKIPSGEITNLPFLDYVARKRKPMIVSTGMSYLKEVEAAVRTLQKTGNKNYILLHCVSQYPAEARDINLKAMETLRKAFKCPVGYSDHSLGIEIAVAAAALGAAVIEKHITLNRFLPGPDHRASLEPDEFSRMVKGIRDVERAMGSGKKEPAKGEADTAAVARKSLVSAGKIQAGTRITKTHIEIKRPGTGLSPDHFKKLVGRVARKNIPAGVLLKMEMFQ